MKNLPTQDAPSFDYLVMKYYKTWPMTFTFPLNYNKYLGNILLFVVHLFSQQKTSIHKIRTAWFEWLFALNLVKDLLAKFYAHSIWLSENLSKCCMKLPSLSSRKSFLRKMKWPFFSMPQRISSSNLKKKQQFHFHIFPLIQIDCEKNEKRKS